MSRYGITRHNWVKIYHIHEYVWHKMLKRTYWKENALISHVPGNAILTDHQDEIAWKKKKKKDWLPEMKGLYWCIEFYETWHDDVIKWKHFSSYWLILWGIRRSPVNSPHRGQWRGAFVFSLICAWINVWINNGGAGNLRSPRAHYHVIVIKKWTHLVNRPFLSNTFFINIYVNSQCW